jgi:cellulose synthase/poly-beta-1,6-N-acetylglucosamine synthase-like glycosyltransferase
MLWEVLFLVLVGSLASAYLAYPAAVWLASRVAPYRSSVDALGDDALPAATLLVPAHNEEQVIEEKIRNFLELEYPPERLACAVVSDASTDATCRLVRELLGRLPEEAARRVTLFDRGERSGKTIALSETVPQTAGELLVFTDANTRFEPDAVRRLARHFADPRVGLVCGRLQYREASPEAAGGEALYWRYENRLKEGEGRVGRLLVSNGSIYAVRRELFEPVPGPVADDLVVPLVVASAGYRTLYEREALASEILPSDASEDFESKARIITQGFEAVYRYRDRVLRSGILRILQYLLHKVIRWLAPLILILALGVCFVGSASPWLAVMLWLQLAFYALAGIGWLTRKRERSLLAVRVAFHFCLLNAAALKGFIDFLGRRDRSTWEKSESTRRADV